MALRVGGWLATAIVLYGAWLLAAALSDNANLDGTSTQRSACAFLVLTCWPAIYFEKVLGSVLALFASLLLEGLLGWETGRFILVMIGMFHNIYAGNTAHGIHQDVVHRKE